MIKIATARRWKGSGPHWSRSSATGPARESRAAGTRPAAAKRAGTDPSHIPSLYAKLCRNGCASLRAAEQSSRCFGSASSASASRGRARGRALGRALGIARGIAATFASEAQTSLRALARARQLTSTTMGAPAYQHPSAPAYQHAPSSAHPDRNQSAWACALNPARRAGTGSACYPAYRTPPARRRRAIHYRRWIACASNRWRMRRAQRKSLREYAS